MRRLSGKRLFGQDSERLLRVDVKDAALNRTERTALENNAAHFDLGGLAGSVTSKDSLLTVVPPGVGKIDDVGTDLGKRSKIEPLDKRSQHAAFFKDVQLVVVPAILADETVPARRHGRGLACGNAFHETVVDANAVG